VAFSEFIDRLTTESEQPQTYGALPSKETATCAEAWRYETSEAPRNAAHCSRRAGKTFTGRRRAIRVAASGSKRWVHVVSLIRRNAKKHWWTGIKSTLHELGWRPRLWEQDMILQLENGSYIQALGIDDEADVKRLQGDYSNLIIGDEAHLPKDDVQKSFFAAAVPMLADYGGAFDWLGLPPEVEPTEFSQALDNPEWARFHWDMFSHDYPTPASEKLARVEQDLKARGMTWEHPEAQRTYKGKRVRDPSKTAYEYQRGRNDYDPRTVDFDRPGWCHTVGQDQGWSDKDAIAVPAWRYDDPQRRVYIRFVWNRNHIPTSVMCKLVKAVQAVYAPSAWVIDHAGGGSQRTVNDLQEHLGIALQRKPTDVAVSLGLINDDFRTGRLLFPTADTETVRVEAQLRKMFRGEELDEVLLALKEGYVQPELAGLVASVSKIYDPITRKIKINTQSKHVDISEAIRYGHHAAKNHLASAPAPLRLLTVEEREDEREQEEFSGRGQTWYQRQAQRRRHA
jgi:hypothetical protein